MRAYIMSLVGASFLASLICGLFPKEEGKWVRFAAGLAVACAVLRPAFSQWEIPDISLDAAELEIHGGTYLKDAFEERLSQETEAHLEETCNAEVAVTVFAQTGEEGEILGVSHVGITPYTKELAKYTAEFLGMDAGKVVEK